MRRKNRQLKITLDIPEQYDDDTSFIQDLADQMDATKWHLKVDDENGEPQTCPISKIQLGNLEIEPEEEEG